MRILHSIASIASHFGGPSKACLEMCDALAKRGHLVDIFTTNYGEAFAPQLQHLRENLRVFYFGTQCSSRWRLSLGMAKVLKQKLSTYDIVHIHSLYLFPNLVTGYYCREFKVPYIIRPHGTLDPYLYQKNRFLKSIMEKAFEDTNIRHSEAIHFTAREEYELAKPYIFDRPPLIIPLGLNSSDYVKPGSPSFFSRFPELRGKNYFLFLSRLHSKKGLDILLPAFSKLTQLFPHFHLVIAGPDGGFESRVKELISREKIHDRVSLVGMLEGAEKLDAFHSSSGFVLPSYSENFGISVIEALLCGCPVIVSNKVNIWQEIQEAHCGLICNCSVEDLFQKLLWAAQNLSDFTAMGKNGRQMVRERYDWTTIGKTLETSYEDIIQRFRKNPT